MEYTTLGRTGLKVSVAGLGSGGSSQLGRRTGKTENETHALVRTALDLGVNFIDTAAGYGTEELIGGALVGVPRDSVVISTKALGHDADAVFAPETFVANLDTSLRRLRTDYIDVFHVHGVRPSFYTRVQETLAPVLLREKEKGKIRHIGITEFPPADPEHATLRRAIEADPWDVIMVALHMMNQNTIHTVLPRTQARDIGVLIMFAVRTLFSRPDRLRAAARDLAAQGLMPADMAERENPLDFLIHPGGADSISDAAYRFARHTAGAHVILFGTGDINHLKQNIASIVKPPLPAADRARLETLFSGLIGIGLDNPNHVAAKAKAS